MYGYIYLATNLINLKKYLGKHEYDKPEIDPKYHGSGTILKKAIKKYGIENFKFEILESVNSIPTICNTEEELNISEYYYSVYYDVVNSKEYYNLIYGGQGGNTWGYLDAESLANAVQKRLNTLAIYPEINGRSYIGHLISEGKKNQSEQKKLETSINISKALTGLKKSDEHCKNISISRIKLGTAKGKNNPNYSKICVFKGDKEEHIYQQQLDEFLAQGYQLGRPAEVNKKAGDSSRGTKWYHKENEKPIRIKPELISHYEALGYKPGKK